MFYPLMRGVFHIFGGLSIVVAALFLPRMTLLVSLAIVTLLFLTFEFLRLRASTVNRWVFLRFKPLLRGEEESRLTGASYMLIASLIAFLAFRMEIAVLAICFLAVGDALAGIVGRYAGRRKVFGKTLEGDLACLASCVAVGLAFYYLGFNIRLPTVLVGSISATTIEAIPLPINDNLTVPLVAAVVMMVMELY